MFYARIVAVDWALSIKNQSITPDNDYWRVSSNAAPDADVLMVFCDFQFSKRNDV